MSSIDPTPTGSALPDADESRSREPLSIAMRGVPIPPFYAGEIGRRAALRARSGLPVFPMHFGSPTAGAPTSARAAVRQHLDESSSAYWESTALRERIARHYLDTYGVRVSPDRVLLTSGASAGLIAAFTALFAQGDRIGLARPGYPAYRNALTALGRVPVDVACGPETGFRLTPALLAALDAPLHGLIVASPGNPTGAMLGRDELGALAEACRANGTRLISDEIYHGISYGIEATTALAVDDEAIVVNSFSKLFRMPGWRLGWLIAPPSSIARLSAYLINFFLTPPTLSQHAALAAFDDLAELNASVVQYAQNRDRLYGALRGMGISGIAPPDGAFYLYADVGHLTDDSLAFCEKLLDETGIALAPGIDFDPQEGGRFIRFAFAISGDDVERVIERLAPWIARQPRR